MRRAVATAVLTAVAALALPIPNAYACSVPRPSLTLARDRVAAGESLRVSADVIAHEDGRVEGCTMPEMPPPSESPTPGPDETVVATARPEPSETPLVTLPPIVPVAYEVPDAAGLLVTVTIAEYREWPAPDAPSRTIDVVPPKPMKRWDADEFVFAFAADVRIPADVRPGRYVLNAYQPKGVWFGQSEITVVDSLAATGSPTGDLLRLGLLSLLAGAGVLVAARRA